MPRLEILEDRTVPSTLTVSNNLDSGAGSLRDTIKAAKSGDKIVFAPSLNGQTISLTSGELAVGKNLDIEGPGASLLAVSGNDTYRVFDISQGLTVTIAGLTIAHGLGTGNVQGENVGVGGGGGVMNGGSTVNLANDVFSSNRAEHGGAISNGPGSVLTILNSSFLANRAVGKVGADYIEGGAIWNTDNNDTSSSSKGAGATATIIGCTFIGNQAIAANGGSITGNSAVLSEVNGGAIHNEGPSDYLTVKNSTFIGNQAIAGNYCDASKASGGFYVVAFGDGGAIANDEGEHCVIDGCTFSYNEAIGGSNAIGSSSGSGRVGHANGGAVASEGLASITNCAFDHNEALGGSNSTGGSGVVLLGRAAGGAIGSFLSTAVNNLTVSNCTFTGNQAIGGSGNTGGLIVGIGVGGGIANDRGAPATVTDCTFTGNQAIGGAGATGQNGANGLGGGIANYLGSTLTVSGCTLIGNQAIGGNGGVGGNGGNGLGGGLYNDGLSIWPANAGIPATLTVTGSAITDNQAIGGAAGSGGSVGEGIGGGAYFASGGSVCLDAFTVAEIFANTASTSNDDIFGAFTICS